MVVAGFYDEGERCNEAGDEDEQLGHFGSFGGCRKKKEKKEL